MIGGREYLLTVLRASDDHRTVTVTESQVPKCRLSESASDDHHGMACQSDGLLRINIP
jgi:hypothetical protein